MLRNREWSVIIRVLNRIDDSFRSSGVSQWSLIRIYPLIISSLNSLEVSHSSFDDYSLKRLLTLFRSLGEVWVSLFWTFPLLHSSSLLPFHQTYHCSHQRHLNLKGHAQVNTHSPYSKSKVTLLALLSMNQYIFISIFYNYYIFLQ